MTPLREPQLISIASVVASMCTAELEYMFRFIATKLHPGYLDDINCVLRRVCTEQENLRLDTQ